MSKKTEKSVNHLLELTKEKLRINHEINQTYETLIASLKDYMGDKFEKKLETYIFDRRYIQLVYIMGYEVLSKGHFIHSDLYARTSLSDRSVDRYISYMLEIDWINELASDEEDKRVKRYIWYPKKEVYRFLYKAEYDEQMAFKQFSGLSDELPLMPELEDIVQFNSEDKSSQKREIN